MFMRRFAFALCLTLLLPTLLMLSGCAEKQEKPSASSGYYDGKMTPAGGGKTKSKGATE